MKKTILAAALLLATISACKDSGKSASQTPQKTTSDSITTQKTQNMNNLISIVEIPVTDFSRAVTFYQTLLQITIEEMEMDGVKMGVLPNEEGTVNVVLVKGNDYKPTTEGAVLYLNAGDDLQPTLDKVEPIGGKIIVPKTQISPEMGYFAMFIDSEGNKMGLHSTK